MRQVFFPLDRIQRWIPLIAIVTALSAACSAGEQSIDTMATEVVDAEGASMGSVAFPVSCTEEASSRMRLGLALLHNMTYTEAEAAFRSASEQDPECALAYWGVAMTYVHPLWPDVPSAAQFESGRALLEQARTRGTRTPREEAYVAALEAYYRDGETRDEPARLASYAAAWAQVAADHPDDPEAALFRALSLMATAPGSDQTFATQREAGAIAEQVLTRIPDHPGAHHYTIHAYDFPPLAERALPVARSYGNVAPDNSHALHMTSHIFTRVGLWEESIEYNARAADAALHHPINGATSHHHLHAMDYLAYAHLQRAEDGKAQGVLDHLTSLGGIVVDNSVTAYAFAAVPARIALERQRWADAARLESRRPATLSWDKYPHLEAITEFARALGHAHSGNMAAARKSVARLGVLQTQAAALPGAYDWGIQVKIQEVAARAWIAYGEGRTDEAVKLMKEAAALEATTQKNPVTPGEVLPAGELLGDMLLDLKRYDDALAAYRSALERSPNRLNSLYGAGHATELAGDEATATEYYRQLVAVAPAPAGTHPRLDRAQRFLNKS
jgi:tetratricopeptide (TPR) repeat protein